VSAERFEKTIGLADMHGTVAAVTFEPPEEIDELGYVSIQLRTGGATIIASPTPKALRELAGAYLDAADAMEGLT
jgi:hypothetical protein